MKENLTKFGGSILVIVIEIYLHCFRNMTQRKLLLLCKLIWKELYCCRNTTVKMRLEDILLSWN